MNPAVRTGTPAPDAPHIPVAIVGAGACGLVAALTLRDAGVECVLLERDAQPSGSTALSSGFIPAAGTAMQQAAGIQDSPAQFAADIQAKAHGTAAAHLVAAFSARIGAALDTLQARHGITFEVLVLTGYGLLAYRLGGLALSPAAERRMARVSGGIFMALAAGMAIARLKP